MTERLIGSIGQEPKKLFLGLACGLPDFVDEERPTVAPFEASGLSGTGTAEGSVLVTEQLRFDEVLAQSGATEVKKTLAPSGTVVMNDLADEPFSRARFADDHDVHRRRCHLPHELQNPLHFGAGAMNTRNAVAPLTRRP